MEDPIVQEIRHALSRTTPGNWHTSPYGPSGGYIVSSTTPSGGSSQVATVRTPSDAHFIAHSKDYIIHLLHLLEKNENN